MLNQVLNMLKSVKPEGVESFAGKIDVSEMPFIEDFIYKYIYR